MKKFVKIFLLMICFFALMAANLTAIVLPLFFGDGPDKISAWWTIAVLIFAALEYAAFGAFADRIGKFMSDI